MAKKNTNAPKTQPNRAPPVTTPVRVTDQGMRTAPRERLDGDVDADTSVPILVGKGRTILGTSSGGKPRA
jgi:hypothetical protein